MLHNRSVFDIKFDFCFFDSTKKFEQSGCQKKTTPEEERNENGDS